MSVESDADRLIFLDPALFGVEALYEPNGGQPKTIVGIFNDEHHEFHPNRWPGSEYQQQSGAHFSSTAPTFECRTSDLLRGGRNGDHITITAMDGLPIPDEDRVRYRVQDPRPDGTGMTVLVLMIDD